MRNLTKTVIAAASLICGASAAQAQTAAPAPAPDFVLSATVTGTTDYRFRGISQNANEFAPQGSVTLTGPDGFYASLWTSKTNWGGNTPSWELDEYAGKHTDLWGTDLNVEAYLYSYPDFSKTKAGVTKPATYYETIGQLTHAFGPLTFVLTGANSPGWTEGGGVGWYVEGSATWAVTDWLSISGNVGHQWVSHAPSDYTHADIGATATWKSFSLDARYMGTDIGKKNCGFWISTPVRACGGGFVATLNYNISNLFQ